ncbi:hypothetical protein [Acinetobacter nematophilus]|uniref:Uncharacterized protein n=1 Tax=Acinetobacter nematophilus TaxID=2994642 RepID=A0A9X3DVG5_9GAMM|nr:hypothetical protein [Acinetobacter nematophilus]MCX5469245.1 hypothetical protein [Acinetobacter nematophilus]
MFIQNLENFPIIPISFQPADAVSVTETIAIYESLLNRKEIFVFLSEGAFSEPQADHEARKQVAAWVKSKREILAQYVKAFIHIEPDANIRLETQKFANNFIKFSGYPMFVVDNQQQANKIIDALLRRQIG